MSWNRSLSPHAKADDMAKAKENGVFLPRYRNLIRTKFMTCPLCTKEMGAGNLAANAHALGHVRAGDIPAEGKLELAAKIQGYDSAAAMIDRGAQLRALDTRRAR